MGTYSHETHEQIMIRRITKTKLTRYKEVHSLNSLGEAIQHLLDRCEFARTSSSVIEKRDYRWRG